MVTPTPAPHRSLAGNLRRGTVALLRLVRAAWLRLRPVLRTVLQILLALLIVFEEWGWQPLSNLLGRLAKFRPWAAIERGIARLPPYAALVVFALPTLLLLPLKFLAIFLVAEGQIMLAGILFLAAKVVATALIARLFLLTQPALMQIGWFVWLHDHIMPWKNALTDQVHQSQTWRIGRLWKERIRRVLLHQWWQMRPKVRRARAYLAVGTRAARTIADRSLRAAGRRIASYLAR